MATEKRLIDANALKIHRMHNTDANHPLDVAYRKDIDNAPTVDAVEVVRCKDCKYWKDSWVAPDGKQSHGYCHLEDADDVIVGRWDDDFCSYGERKDNG